LVSCLFVDPAGLGSVEAHLDVDVLVGELGEDDVVELVVVIAVHVEHERLLGRGEKRGEHAVDVVDGRVEGAHVGRIPVQKSPALLVAAEVVPVERGDRCGERSRRGQSRPLP
jgi:hypothetical protein